MLRRFLFLSFLGCAGVSTEAPSIDAATQSLRRDSVQTEALYFGHEHFAFVSNGSFFGEFTLTAGSSATLRVTGESNPRAHLEARLYRVSRHGQMQLIERQASRGVVTLRPRSARDEQYVVEARSLTPGGTMVKVRLNCSRRDGLRCTPQSQPGEACGSRGTPTCDVGLFCHFAPGCGRFDGGGVCEVQPDVCPAVECNPVCGCDGQTYCDACAANSNGVTVETAGPCITQCELGSWSKPSVPVQQHELSGIWVTAFSRDRFDIRSRLALDGSRFEYEQVWDPTCLHTPPYCRRPSLVHQTSGTCTVTNNSLQLIVEGETHEQLAEGFSIEQECGASVERVFRLTTTELGEDHVLVRDACASIVCEAPQHCELVEVQCVRAPCPPIPSCVD